MAPTYRTTLLQGIQVEELKLQQAGKYTNLLKPAMVNEQIRNNIANTDDILDDIKAYREDKGQYRRKPVAKCGVTYTPEEESEVVALVKEGIISQEEGSLILNCSSKKMNNILLGGNRPSPTCFVSILKEICSEIVTSDGKYYAQLNIHDFIEEFRVDLDLNVGNYDASLNNTDDDSIQPHQSVQYQEEVKI